MSSSQEGKAEDAAPSGSFLLKLMTAEPPVERMQAAEQYIGPSW